MRSQLFSGARRYITLPCLIFLAGCSEGVELESQIEDLLSEMTLAEKIGQMTLVEQMAISPGEVRDLGIGAVFSGGNGAPAENNPEAWAAMVGRFRTASMESRLGIPILYGVDAIHGHNGLHGAVVFPHAIGLGATRDPELVRRVARVTAEEMLATGINWNYAPVLAVPQDVRWGRTYESFSDDTELVSLLAAAYLEGLQGSDLSDPIAVLGTPKHFIGDGATAFGSSAFEIMVPYLLDQGDAQIPEGVLRTVHLPPYQLAIELGALSVMASFSSWNGVKLHGHPYLLTEVLKEELGFDGFVVSDYQGIDQLSEDYAEAVVLGVNAGIDMNMVPHDYERFISVLTDAVERGDVSLERIDDAVRRILRVKSEMGLDGRLHRDPALAAEVGSDQHRALAREAVARSTVLLKNTNEALPIPKDVARVFVAGEGADDIGMQCGGWTLGWQGSRGPITEGTTILEAIRATVSETTDVAYEPIGDFGAPTPSGEPPSTCIGVIGEEPYAEGVGDSEDLSISDRDLGMLRRLEASCGRLIVVLISGRPMVVTDLLPEWDAFVAAWLPGTEGRGVADVLFGDSPFTGKLPVQWPKTAEQLPLRDQASDRGEGMDPLFERGFGLGG